MHHPRYNNKKDNTNEVVFPIGDKPKPSAVPTSEAVAPTQVAAAASCSPQSGVVKVTSEDGSVDGFLAAPVDDAALYGFTTNQTAAATVKLDTCTGTPFNIVGTPFESNVRQNPEACALTIVICFAGRDL